MWNRWKAGQSLNEIGRALGKDERRWDFKLRRIDCKPVLRLPHEITSGYRKAQNAKCDERKLLTKSQPLPRPSVPVVLQVCQLSKSDQFPD